jgi:chromosome segregation ATPase
LHPLPSGGDVLSGFSTGRNGNERVGGSISTFASSPGSDNRNNAGRNSGIHVSFAQAPMSTGDLSSTGISSAATVITPSGVIVQGGVPSDPGRLAVKVQAQARELAELSLRLARSETYSHLVERRLLEVSPSHPMPVSEHHMGQAVEQLSKLALAAAQTLTGAVTPGKISGLASHVISQTAAQRKKTLDQSEQIRELEKALEKERKKVEDLSQKSKEMKQLLTNKDKDRANAIRRADGLQHKVISLEAEMRLAGLVPTAAPSSGVSDIVPQPSSRSISPHVSGEVEVLNQRVVQLKEEISSLRSSHSAISERLERESRGGDQQRSYIAVLERQLEKTASSPDTAQLLTQNARLQGELEARVRESSSRDAAVRETTLQLREANSAIAGLKTQLADTQTRYATLQQQASRIGPSSVLKSPSTPSRKNTSSAGMVVSSPSLGDISTASHVQRVGFPSTTLPQHALELVSRLEAEKGALLDYIAETRDASAHLVATNEQLLAGKADLEGLLARVRGESDANVRAASLAEAEVARMNKQLIDMQSRIASYDSRIADISRDYASASAQLATRASEVGEMTAVQEELLNTIRTHKRIADDAKRESDALRAKLLEAGRKLDADEATLEHIEGQRDANEQRVRELRAQCDASMARVNSLVEQNDKLMSDLTRAQAEKAGAEARISNFEKRVEALERHKQELENAIRSTEAQNGKTGAELDALLVKDRRVQESEARALKYLRSAALATAAANATTVQPGSQEIRSPGDFFPLSDSDDSDGPADPVALLASFAAQEAALFSDQPQSYHVNGSVGGGSLPGTPSRKTAVGGTHAQNRDDDTSTFKRMQLASVAGSRAVTRAEGALRWATDPSLNAAVPQVATACRQLSGWLRTAGMALSDVSRRTSQELEDRRLQRRMLYEEIHSLRDQLKDTLDNLSSERSRANENEARALSLSRQLDTDVQRLSQRHEDAVTERDMLRSSHERLQKSHSDGQLEIGKLSTKVETLSAQLSGASSAHERSAKLADRLASDLRQAEIERDALHDQLQDVQQQLEEARSHSSILQIERKALGDRVIALEAGTKESQSEVKALNEKVMNAQRDAQLAIQRAEQAQGSVSAECDKVSSLTFTANQLREALNESEQLALRQNELLDQMGTQMRSMGEEKGAMQRSMAGLSVELEGAKTALQSASSEFSQKIDSFVGGLRRVGVDVVVPSTNPSGPNAQLILPTVAAAEAFYIHTEQQNSSVSSFGLHSSSPVYALVQKQRSLLSTLLVAGTAATNRVSALLTELGAKKQEIASMKPRLDAVNEVVSTSQEKQRALSSCEAQIAELRSLLAQTESQLVTAQNECQSLRARLGDQQSELERSNTRVAMLVADSEGYRDSERRAQAAFTEAQSQISALNEEIAGMRREQDNLIQQRARAEASTHREVSRMNDLASDMATVNAHKARAEQALARANESVASLRAEVIELRSQLNASLAKGNEFQSSLAEKEAELLAQRQQVRQMASMHAELEQQVARDMQVLSSETVEAVTVRQQTVDVLAVKSAEIEAMKAEISALRSAQQANSTASALPSSTFSTSYPTRTSNANLFAGSNGSRAPSPVERAQPAASMGSGGSIYTQSPSRYSMQALGAPAPSLYSSLQLSSTSLPSSTIIQRTGGNNNISDLPPLYPSQDSVPIGLGRTMASTSMMQSLVPSSNSNTVTASGSASGGSSSTTTTTAGFQSPGTAKLMQRFQAAQQRFEQFKNSS